MSNSAKIGIGVLVLLVLLAILFIMGGPKAEAPSDGTGTSDQALRDEAAAVDAELEGLDGDRAMIDQGLETNVSAE